MYLLERVWGRKTNFYLFQCFTAAACEIAVTSSVENVPYFCFSRCCWESNGQIHQHTRIPEGQGRTISSKFQSRERHIMTYIGRDVSNGCFKSVYSSDTLMSLDGSELGGWARF